MSYTIMVVENSVAVRNLIKFELEESGYKIIEAKDGEDALKKMSPDVNMVFTDLNMPVMDGLELIKKIRADSRFKFLPVIVVTTESRTSAKKEKAKAAGATAWISKPFKPTQLLSLVKKILG